VYDLSTGATFSDLESMTEFNGRPLVNVEYIVNDIR